MRWYTVMGPQGPANISHGSLAEQNWQEYHDFDRSMLLNADIGCAMLYD